MYFSSDQVCASNPGKDACQGDSGGPLTLIENSRWNDDNMQIYILTHMYLWKYAHIYYHWLPGIHKLGL